MSEISELYTIGDMLRWTVSRFNEAGLYYGHGTDNAWDDAVALILHTIHLPHAIDRSVFNARLTTEEREKIYALVKKRISHRLPVPYLTHEAWFGGLSFFVDERVLIPRSPIAELIEQHFSPWLQNDPTHILDLCTGSGCIAIACAKAFPDATVDASDISHDALAVAKINLLRHKVEDQVTLYHSDLFQKLPKKSYDLIISNPPYVDEADMNSLPAEFRHEPTLGLTAGKDGLAVVLRILRDAKDHLAPGGNLIIEVGNSEVALAEKFPEIPFTWIEFQQGGGGVFVLTQKELLEHQAQFNA